MKSLFISFLKRFLLIPILVTVVVIAVIAIKVPNAVSVSNLTVSASAPDVDISVYNLVEYEKFSSLKEGDYVATVSSDEISLGCAVCYESTNDLNAVTMLKCSKEPWLGGSVVLMGENVKQKFKYLHNSTIGTEININFYKNATCKYKITSVEYNHTQEELKDCMKKADLVLCVAYKDFESPNGSNLYITYFAELGGVELWK